MTDIELIIKIPEELLKYFNSFYLMNVNENKNVDKLVEAIKKGKQLTIGHGRLIDADERRTEIDEADRWVVDLAQTIIEADKTESEDKKWIKNEKKNILITRTKEKEKVYANNAVIHQILFVQNART